MKIDVRNVNIWKDKPASGDSTAFRSADIEELCLTVRSYNCLKRAGCSSVGSVVDLIGEDGQGLLNIRNLGRKSYEEIIRNVQKLEILYRAREGNHTGGSTKSRILLRPEGKMWNTSISSLNVSGKTETGLKDCGVYKVGDLYSDSLKSEPGWYMIRELFDAIALKAV